MTEKERIKVLNKSPVIDRKYVFYWMQAAQRIEFNHALEYAIEWANVTNRPLIIHRIVEAIERQFIRLTQSSRQFTIGFD
jgi:deoxyribodipyrimidine photolyase